MFRFVLLPRDSPWFILDHAYSTAFDARQVWSIPTKNTNTAHLFTRRSKHLPEERHRQELQRQPFICKRNLPELIDPSEMHVGQTMLCCNQTQEPLDGVRMPEYVIFTFYIVVARLNRVAELLEWRKIYVVRTHAWGNDPFLDRQLNNPIALLLWQCLGSYVPGIYY